MCVLCYTMGSGIGEAALFGGPFAFAAVRKVRAGIDRLTGREAAPPADEAAPAPDVVGGLEPVAPPERVPARATA